MLNVNATVQFTIYKKLQRMNVLLSIMKLSVVFVFCFVSTILYSVEGGLVKDFFGKVKETAEVVHKDVHKIWRPESGKSDNAEHTVTTPVAISAAKDHVETDEKKDGNDKVDENKKDVKVSEITTPSITATEHKEKDEKHIEATTAASVNSETTTKKDERANFSGACQANYRRTADGRCKLVGA
ncbi:growth-blocking peptide, long form-like [Leguminivora glycinivorella]|uniref:growth-blocking peptide, long form-like n=1 Tax=Leguminivora glycinivorella TaxID=1035111 RepID=UPI00200BDC9E|nr:growth-blocking peptide, long form-like [Leguminivora glycinivorella]